MARYSTMRKPTRQQLLRLEVVRTEQISAHWMRVTLGGGQSALFEPMRFDQWFRLFIPAAATDDAREALDRVPANANKTMGYFKFLATIPQSVRPIMRNYSVRTFRPADSTAGRTAEIEVPAPPVHAFIVGEQALPTSARRHLVEAGVPKEHISFVGYWRMPAKQK